MSRLQQIKSLLASAVVLFLSAAAAQADYKLTTLVTFNGANGNGPLVGLVADASGNLYGMTSAGGADGNGTLFELAAGTHAFNIVTTFNGAGLIADASGNLYGTTRSGGTLNGGVSGYGTVFELAADTHALSTLATFDYLTNGAYPDGRIVADASGNIYGTTSFGGDLTLNAGSGDGTVFELAAGTNVLRTLATFNGMNGNGPVGGLITDASGNLYGMTFQGGANDNGTVFELAAGTHVLSTLATFNGTNGGYPNGGLIADASGNLYGTTNWGGVKGDGTVFEVAAGTHTLSTLATFNGQNGTFPRAGLVADASGNLYGTTSFGGDLTLNAGYGLGTVFEVAAGTHALTTLASFNGTNGNYPLAGLVADANGNLYGTTEYGGDLMLNGGLGFGIVFELSPVPEPSTLLLGALGAASIFARRWWNCPDRSYCFPHHKLQPHRKATMNTPVRPSRITRSTLLLAVIAICGPTRISPAFGQIYLGIDLYTLTQPSGFVGSLSLDNESSGAGQVVSYGTLASGKSHALLWNGPAGTVVDLHPTNLSGFNQSFALRTSGTQQVGEIDKANGVFHAVLWSGAANTAVDLNPTNLTGYAGSTAYGISGSQQVGLGGGSATQNNTHALLWTGAANTAVDLQPTNLVGFTDSEAFFTDGANQVGDGDGTATGGTNHVHALLWSGAANSAVDLHPTSLSGFSDSSVEAVSGNQEVGEGHGSSTGFSDHALVWSGTAISAIDLQPTILSGFTDSRAIGTNGAKQIGNGTRIDLSTHALVWSGTAGSAVDLNPFLPAGFTSSEADLIDSQGIIYGEALDSSGNIHAVEWTPVVAGDYNQNGTVDAADYTVWRDTLGSTTDLRANGDDMGPSASVVDQADYEIWKANFGQMAGNGSSAIAAVPESASILFAALGFLGLAIYCGRTIQ